MAPDWRYTIRLARKEWELLYTCFPTPWNLSRNKIEIFLFFRWKVFRKSLQKIKFHSLSPLLWYLIQKYDNEENICQFWQRKMKFHWDFRNSPTFRYRLSQTKDDCDNNMTNHHTSTTRLYPTIKIASDEVLLSVLETQTHPVQYSSVAFYYDQDQDQEIMSIEHLKKSFQKVVDLYYPWSGKLYREVQIFFQKSLWFIEWFWNDIRRFSLGE